MAIELNNKNEDPQFLELVNRILGRLLEMKVPQEVYITQVAGWFDHKWLGFSGIGVVDFPYGYPWVESALDEFCQDQITFPPFTPNRILQQRSFLKTTRGLYEEAKRPRLIHKPGREWSCNNLHRRVSAFVDSGLMVWLSSSTLSLNRASLMVYSVEANNVATWFASFRKAQGWELYLTKLIRREVIQEWLSSERRSANRDFERLNSLV